MSGLSRIAAERQRQLDVEGWTPAHDDEHDEGELAQAAACYALEHYDLEGERTFAVPYDWPWEDTWWRPGPDTIEGRIRDLEKAGALCAAEIDRLERLLATGQSFVEALAEFRETATPTPPDVILAAELATNVDLGMEPKP